MAHLAPKRFSAWDSEDSKGALLAIGCQPDATTVLITSTGIWERPEGEPTFVKLDEALNPEDLWGKVWSLSFDLEGRTYVSSEKRGVEVFQDLQACVAGASPIAHIPHFSGPLNLSHPSTGLIGLDNNDKAFGTLSSFSWRPSQWSVTTHDQYPKDFREAVKLLLLIHAREDSAISALSKDVLFKIISHVAPEELFVRKIHDNFWSGGHSTWLTDPGERKNIRCLRRSWYGTSIMWYFVDEGGWAEPDDGVRCLATYNRPNDYNNIIRVDHTFISVGTHGLPFSIEIPHGPNGEILVFSPESAVIAQTSIGLALPEYEPEAKYNWIMTATDREGSSRKRTKYVIAYEKQVGEEKEWYLFEVAAVQA